MPKIGSALIVLGLVLWSPLVLAGQNSNSEYYGARIRFEVREYGSGKPIKGASITFRVENNNGWEGHWWYSTEDDGTLLTQEVFGRQYVFRVDKDGYYPYEYGGCSAFQVPQPISLPPANMIVQAPVIFLRPIVDKKAYVKK